MRTPTHTTPAVWVAGMRVQVTYSPTTEGRAPVTAFGTIVEPKPRRGDPGPYRIPWVKVDADGPYGPQDRPFPTDWLTTIDN